MQKRTEKIVIIVSPEEKAAIVDLAGGRGEVGQFIRYLCYQAALHKDEAKIGDTLGEEFREATRKAVEAMVEAAMRKEKEKARK